MTLALLHRGIDKHYDQTYSRHNYLDESGTERLLALPPPPVLSPPQPVPEPIPLPEPEPPPVEADFFAGYRDGGAPYSEAHIWNVVFCESGWNVVTGGWFLGLAQFHPGTWSTVAARTGLWEWASPYHQGYNMAVWASMVSPGTTAGWPVCWWV